MSYHLKGAQYRCAEMLEAKGMKLTKEEIKGIKVWPIKKDGCGVFENVKIWNTPEGQLIWFETTEVVR